MSSAASDALRGGRISLPALPSASGDRTVARRRLAVVAEAAGAGLLALACAAWALKLWRSDLALPLRYTAVDDTKFYLMLVKGVLAHGWFQTNASLGAPFGQQLYDFPQGADSLHFLLIRFLGLFSTNPALVANLFYLASYVLTALTCHLVLRALGLSRGTALVGAVLFAVLPYHFFRGESHLLLAAYYAVPLAAYLFFLILGEREPFTRRSDGGPRLLRWASGRSLGTVALCAIVGSAGLYYAVLSGIMLTAATVVAIAARRPRRQVLGGVAVAAIVALTVGANLAPTFSYETRHGADQQLTRSATDDEQHGLKLTNLVLPNPNSRIAPLADLAAEYDNQVAPTYCEACYGTLGTVGTVGFVWLGIYGLAVLLGTAAWYAAQRRLRLAALGVALALAVTTIGGISSLIEFFVTPDIRGWNRISVFIAFFSLLSAGLLLERLVGWTRRLRFGGFGAPAVLGAVLAFGVYDQTSDYFVPDYSGNAREYRSDAAFVGQIQSRLAHGASVFQLPYVPFPEGYPATSASPSGVSSFQSSYELLRGYLHSSTLRWSYGAMKGRAADWASALAGQPLGVVVPAVAAAGFDGIWVDPQGYTPEGGRAVRGSLQALLGQAPLVSLAGDLWFFDLRAYRARLSATHSSGEMAALRQSTLAPLRASCTSGGLALVNPTRVGQPATLTLRVQNYTGLRNQPLRLELPGERLATALAGPHPSTVAWAVNLAPGVTTVPVTSVGNGPGAQLLSEALTSQSQQAASAVRAVGGATPTGITGPGCPINPAS